MILSLLITIVKADCDWFVYEEDLQYNGRKVHIDHSTKVTLTPAWPNIWLAMDPAGRTELHRMTMEHQTIAFSNGPNRVSVFVVDIENVRKFYAMVVGAGSCKVSFDNPQKAKVKNVDAYFVDYS